MLRSPVAARPCCAFALVLASLGLALVAGCGGGGDAASSDDAVNKLLKQTFSGDKKIESGNLDLSLASTPRAPRSSAARSSLRLTGPFQSQGKGKLPKFKHRRRRSRAAGQNITAGIDLDGRQGLRQLPGTDYVVTDQVSSQFKAGYEQAQQKADKRRQSLSTLGIDPRNWLTNPRNAGEARSATTDAIKITGGVDIDKMLDDVNTALEKARTLGVPAAQNVPNKLTRRSRSSRPQDAIKDPRVEIDTGKDDRSCAAWSSTSA